MDFADINWFFKGVLLSPSQKYIMQKHREISILQINRFSQADVGVYAIQAFGRTTQHVATLNVESKNNFMLQTSLFSVSLCDYCYKI